jgi:hypothetical protein
VIAWTAIHADVNRDTGVATFTIALSEPIGGGGRDDSGGITIAAGAEDAGSTKACGTGARRGGIQVVLDHESAYGNRPASLTASFWSPLTQGNVDVPVAVSPDGLTLTLTANDPYIRQTDPRCLVANGAPPIWFDGQSPVPSGMPAGSSLNGCGYAMLAMRGPGTLAGGTTATLTIDEPEDRYPGEDSQAEIWRSFGGAQLQFVHEGDGKVLASKAFSRTAVTDYGSQYRFKMPVGVTGIVDALLTWTQTAEDEGSGAPSQTCTLKLPIHATGGTKAAFFAQAGSGRDGGGELRPRNQDACGSVAPATVVVTVRGGGRTARFTRRDGCGNFRGRSRDIDGMHVSADTIGGVSFMPRRNGGRAKVTVTVGGRRVLVRTAHSHVHSTPDRRIYALEDTDEWIDYCADKDWYKTRDGDLFCVRPGRTTSSVTFAR